jgi:hypothetical protein
MGEFYARHKLSVSATARQGLTPLLTPACPIHRIYTKPVTKTLLHQAKKLLMEIMGPAPKAATFVAVIQACVTRYIGDDVEQMSARLKLCWIRQETCTKKKPSSERYGTWIRTSLSRPSAANWFLKTPTMNLLRCCSNASERKKREELLIRNEWKTGREKMENLAERNPERS